MSQLQIVMKPVSSLRPADRNARTHSKKQVKQIAASITEFGFTNPVLLNADGMKPTKLKSNYLSRARPTQVTSFFN